MRSPEPFHFMHWAKQWVGRVPYCLGASGVPSVPTDRFPTARVEPGTPNVHGLLDLRKAVAAMHGVGPDSVLVTDGASLANYTALSVLAGPGERILVERPTYPVLAGIPHFHDAVVERLERRSGDRWAPRLEEIEKRAMSGEGLGLAAVVLTRLHNPSGVDLSPTFLRDLATLAETHDFRVLLDEAYLDFVDGADPGHRFSPRFVSTGSLTKVLGFGGLRVGWVVGTPEAIEPMKELSFYLAVDGAALSQAAAVQVIAERKHLLARARSLAAIGGEIVGGWVRGRDDVSWTPPDAGINGFVRLSSADDTASFADSLRKSRGVNIAEGEFFGAPGWARISFGVAEPTLREALRRIGDALDERAARASLTPPGSEGRGAPGTSALPPRSRGKLRAPRSRFAAPRGTR